MSIRGGRGTLRTLPSALYLGPLFLAAANALGQLPAAEVEALHLYQQSGRTIVRLAAEGRLEPEVVRREADRLSLFLPAVDLARIAGSLAVETPEILEVIVVTEPDGEEGIRFRLAPGVSCDLRLPESGLEVACTGRSEPAGSTASAPPPAEESEPDIGQEPDAEGNPALDSLSNDPPPEPDIDQEPDADAEALRAASAGALDQRGENGGQGLAERVSLDFRDADLRDVLRVLSEISGLDFVLQPGVQGRISLRLTEIPWDQALDVILRSHGLGQIVEGNVLRVGELADLAAERMDLRRHRDQHELAGELVTLRRTLAYVRPEEIEELIEGRLSERGALIADARTGTLLVTDVGVRIRELETILDALDIPAPGVEIEARIVLAAHTLTQRLGIQWGGGLVRERTGKIFPESFRLGGDAIGSASSSFTAGNGGAGVLAPANAEGERPGYAVSLPISGAPTGALGIALGALGGAAHLDLALAAAEKKGDVRILSAPRIVAQNARSATIKQGVTFPVQVVANNTVTVQFRDAVLELTVTPLVSSEGTVLLDMQVSNDSLDFGQAVGGIPSIVTQHATTRVRVVDGATTVIGGVFATQESQDQGRVPGLHRIPLLGHLFRSREQNRRDEELLIFLTPRIRRHGQLPSVEGGG